MFLASRDLEKYLYEEGVDSLAELHLSLNNTDKIAYLIEQLRSIQFPHGQNMEAILQQYIAEKGSDNQVCY